jgi:predicted transcriptional regulator
MKTDWKANGELIRASMAKEQPPIRIEKVMQVLGYSSKSSAENALLQLEKIGVVKRIGAKWYLV